MTDIGTTLILGAWVTRRLLFASLVQGLIFGMLAMGIVLVYRSTRVINFAVGNLGLPGAALFGLMDINYSFPFWVALVAALLIGAAIGAVTEVLVIKRLFNRSRVVLLIATVGIADFWRAIVVIAFPKIDGAQRDFPTAIGTTFENVGGAFGGFAGIASDPGFRVTGSELQTLLVVPGICLLLAWLIQRTLFGKAVTASADNPDLSRLAGISPHVVSTAVWTIGGFLATLSMILLSAGRPASGIENLGPFTLTSALAAAVLAGMRSYPRAMVGGVIMALIGNIFDFNFGGDPGLSTVIVFVVIIVALYWQSRGNDDESALDFAPKVRPLPAHLKQVWWIRNMHRLALGLLLSVVVLFTWQHEAIYEIKNSQFFLYSTILCFAIVATSLTVITGWSGQVSLAQMAYAGIGGLSASAFNRGAELDIGWGDTRIIDVHFDGLPVVVSIVLGAALTAAIAALTGIGALRVRGIMLAVSTFAFAIAAEQYIYQRPFFSDGATSVTFDRGSFFGWDLAEQRSYFYFCIGCLMLVLISVGRLRRSGVGRAMIAVRDNADAASAYTLSPTRVKLTAFAIAGGIAGLGGALFANAVRLVRFGDTHFQLEDSLGVLNMVVIGGVGSVVGPLLGALWIRGLPAFFPGSPVVGLVSSSVGLLVVLMYFPGGLVQIALRTRDAIIDRFARRYTPDGADGDSSTRQVRPETGWLRLVAMGAVLAKIALLLFIAVRAGDHLVGGGDNTTFGVYLALLFASGCLALFILTGMGCAPDDGDQSVGTALGYMGYLVVEPVVPFLWPALVTRWRRADRANSGSGWSTRSSTAPTLAGTALPEVVKPALTAEAVTVRFGGNVAVNSASIHVNHDEIVGLIGTNGAGKSTLMNAIGGYVPSTGQVLLHGQRVDGKAPSARATLGLGRTFQAAKLFPALTVRETVHVALAARHQVSYARTALFLDGTVERHIRSEGDELIDFLGLGRFSDAFISDLSTGTRRIAELAGLLAVGATMLCLDEPTAGVAQRETEAFGPLISSIRREIGASMLIIEHDMPLIMSISDRVYCLEAGQVIAEGQPELVRSDPAVIASYLGVDERAIQRSGS